MDSSKVMGSVANILLNYMNSINKSDNYFDVCKNVLKNLNRMEHININDLADLCFVSPATISRFCKHMGFSSFQEFKKLCSVNLNIETDYSRRLLEASKMNSKEAVEHYTKSVIDNIQSSYNQLDIDNVDIIARKINETNEVAFFGMQFLYNMGVHLQSRFIMMGKLIEAYLSYEEQLECARNLNSNSIAIIASVEGSYFYRCIEIVEELKKNGVKVILFTQNTNSKLASLADEILICGNSNNDNEGRYAVLYMMEILIMRYAALFAYKGK